MASNFKVFKHHNGENVHLKLSGDFDGSSAYELINIIDYYCNTTKNIFIHTSGLSSIHSFGISIFKTKYSRHNNLVFTGEPGKELSLNGSRHIP